jgi:serine protease Do
MSDLTSDQASKLDLPVDRGALVQSVEGGSPAGEAGLRAGSDLIVSVDGKEVDGADDVVNAVSGKKPGDTVEIEFYRGDDRRSVKVELDERPEQLGAAEQQQEQQPDEDDLPFRLP